MNKSLELVLLTLFSLGMVAGAAAQNKPSKSSGRSSAIHHTPARHKMSNVALPDNSKKLNSDLAKLESQTSKTMRPARSAPAKKQALPAKTFNQQDRRNTPPINFTYNGKNGGSSSHTGGASRAPAKATPRMR